MSKDRYISSEKGVTPEEYSPTMQILAIFTSPTAGEPMVSQENVMAN